MYGILLSYIRNMNQFFFHNPLYLYLKILSSNEGLIQHFQKQVRYYENLRHSNHTPSHKHFPVKKQKANSKLPASAVAHTTGNVRKY